MQFASQARLGQRDYFCSSGFAIDAREVLKPDLTHAFAERTARHFCSLAAEVIEALQRYSLPFDSARVARDIL